MLAWEAETGNCFRCNGSGQESLGWSKAEGPRYRQCSRCGGTGKAPQQKPVESGSEHPTPSAPQAPDELFKLLDAEDPLLKAPQSIFTTTNTSTADEIHLRGIKAALATHNPPNPAPLLWLLWNHLGSQSPVGQSIREYLGMGQFDRMTEEQIDAAKHWREAKWRRLHKQAPTPAQSENPQP